jgi:hypothetical protein
VPKNNPSKNAELMQCPECQSTHVNKNGQKKGKQNYICVGCERIKGVHHTSIINWVKQVGELLPDAYEPDTIPLVGEPGGVTTSPKPRTRKD